jgi:hypothetical protein
MDPDHFVHGDWWSKLVRIDEHDCLHGEFFWIDAPMGEVHRELPVMQLDTGV